MTIEIKKQAKETIIEVAGRLDTITAPVLEKTINDKAAFAQLVETAKKAL